jgi:hypothetical protein
MSRTDAASAHALDDRVLPAEIVFLIVVLCLTLFFSLAGIPGAALPEAGEGSAALRQGWAEDVDAVAAPSSASTRPG